MLIDDARTRELLARIVYRLSSDPAVREDLMQEALVHLWLLEERRPGQRQSWYLQSCKFHLQNYLAAGRSVDSPKRRGGKTAYDEEDELNAFSGGESDGENAVFAQVSARDIFSLLCGRLTPFEQAILNHLAEGLGAREIAERMDVTHPTVIKYRRRIAALAIRLGIPPMPKYARHRSFALAR
jgi:DNA-directed RNA polymerase specialized sigma24 family protein